MLDEDESPAVTTSTEVGLASRREPEGLEPLACVACRSRKLKCDRSKPACIRCTRLKVKCTYPESRRKPTFRRRNVQELEERLAQVEVLLKDTAAKSPPKAAEDNTQKVPSDQNVTAPPRDLRSGPKSDADVIGSSVFQNGSGGTAGSGSFNWDFDACSQDESPLESAGVPFETPNMDYHSQKANAGDTSYELLSFGLYESLPPSEMIEELHQAYFTKHHLDIPILHPGRYTQAFYAAPHLRPIMGLQYAVWTMATLGHERYSQYHHAFHRRCRHYLEEDELRGDGEHFLTVAHAQAWSLIATAEARNMWFTKAAMSLSRCIKLLHMLGLHRLDDPNAEFEMMPTILPPKDWIELEERRRVFWAGFAADSHASISTGWPTQIDANEVTTHLPSSEEAFNAGREEKTCRLHDAFTGSSYSSFAASAVVCHVFNRIMKHANRSQPDDCPDNFEYGKYWNRHRELDNLLSGAFIYLPEQFRLPQNIRDAVAVHTNLNFHAAVICLHKSAFEMANEHNLPDEFKKLTRTRLMSASNEVVNIVKLTSHMSSGYRSPLVALSLYVASSAYISQAQDDDGLTPMYAANLEFLLTAMDAVGKQYKITLTFLRQAILELRQAGLHHAVRVPKLGPFSLPVPGNGNGDDVICGPCGQIPLFARSRISKRTAGILPPLPGRLPLNKPAGGRLFPGTRQGNQFEDANIDPLLHTGHRHTGISKDDPETRTANKRRRVNQSPEPSSLRSGNDASPWCQHASVEEVSSSENTPTVIPPPHAARRNPDPSATQSNLPHRGGSSTTSESSPAAGAVNSSSLASSSTTSPGHAVTADHVYPAAVLGAAPNSAAISGAHPASSVGGVDMAIFQGLNGWDAAQDAAQDSSGAFAEVAAAMLDDDSWMVLNDVGVNGQSWGTDTGGAGVGEV